MVPRGFLRAPTRRRPNADTVWVENAETTFDALTELGAAVEITVFDGAGHIPTSTRDGIVFFEQLESFR